MYRQKKQLDGVQRLRDWLAALCSETLMSFDDASSAVDSLKDTVGDKDMTDLWLQVRRLALQHIRQRMDDASLRSAQDVQPQVTLHDATCDTMALKSADAIFMKGKPPQQKDTVLLKNLMAVGLGQRRFHGDLQDKDFEKLALARQTEVLKNANESTCALTSNPFSMKDNKIEIPEAVRIPCDTWQLALDQAKKTLLAGGYGSAILSRSANLLQLCLDAEVAFKILEEVCPHLGNAKAELRRAYLTVFEQDVCISAKLPPLKHRKQVKDAHRTLSDKLKVIGSVVEDCDIEPNLLALAKKCL